jgi:hypothetical protein
MCTLVMVVITVTIHDSLVDVGKCIAIRHVSLITTQQLDVSTFVCADHKSFHKEDAGVGVVDDDARVKALAKQLELGMGNERGTTVQPSPSCTDWTAMCWTKSIEWNLASFTTCQTGTTTRIQMQTGQLMIDALDAHALHPPANSLREMKNTPCRIVQWSNWRTLARHDGGQKNIRS